MMVALLMLTGCGSDREVISVSPKLECDKVVRCHVILWKLGILAGPQVGGMHVKCTCDGDN